MDKVTVFYGKNRAVTGFFIRKIENGFVYVFDGGEDDWEILLSNVKFIVEYKNGEIVNMYNPNDI